jgi:hypothetical protein
MDEEMTRTIVNMDVCVYNEVFKQWLKERIPKEGKQGIRIGNCHLQHGECAFDSWFWISAMAFEPARNDTHTQEMKRWPVP